MAAPKLIVRKLTADSRGELLSLFERMDGDSRYRRFGMPMSREALCAYVQRLDFGRDLVSGAYDGDRLIGVCEAVRYPGGLLVPVTELAFAVDPRYQGNKVGFRLGNQVFDVLPGQLVAVCAVANPPMAKLAHRLGMARAGRTASQGLPASVLEELASFHGLYVGQGRQLH